MRKHLFAAVLLLAASAVASADDAQQTLNLVQRFKIAQRSGDTSTLRALMATDGVYSSVNRALVPRSEAKKLLWSGFPSTQQVAWSEETVPVTRIDFVQVLKPDVKLVHVCEIQPTLLGPGVSSEMVLVKETGEWHIASILVHGACN